jgi:hypothetical protein
MAYIVTEGEASFLALVNATGVCKVFDVEGADVTSAHEAIVTEAKAHAASNQTSYSNALITKVGRMMSGAADITALEVTNETDLRTALANGKSVRLAADVTVSETLVINGDATLELNGKTITNKVDNTLTDVIQVPAGAILTINGNGNITAVSGNDGYAVIADGKLIINGGTFQSGVDTASEPNAVIYARGNGEVYVNGGLFLNDNNTKFVLNKKDADRATTKIEVKGGKFYNFNPADNTAEGAGTNFLATGYKVEETVDGTDNVYTVVAE